MAIGTGTRANTMLVRRKVVLDVMGRGEW